MLYRFIHRLKARIRKYRAEKKLEKSGCQTWHMYRRKYDTGYNGRATRIVNCYHGYKYIYPITDHKHYAYQLIGYYGHGIQRFGYDDIAEWCRENLKHKHRYDFQRVITNYNGEWEVNEIGGSDYWFLAFTDEKDYIHFMLRWA